MSGTGDRLTDVLLTRVFCHHSAASLLRTLYPSKVYGVFIIIYCTHVMIHLYSQICINRKFVYYLDSYHELIDILKNPISIPKRYTSLEQMIINNEIIKFIIYTMYKICIQYCLESQVKSIHVHATLWMPSALHTLCITLYCCEYNSQTMKWTTLTM